MWISFVSTLFAMVMFLSFFTCLYQRYNVKDIGIQRNNIYPRTKGNNLDIILNQFSFYTVYVVNIITNHGTIIYGRLTKYCINM